MSFHKFELKVNCHPHHHHHKTKAHFSRTFTKQTTVINIISFPPAFPVAIDPRRGSLSSSSSSADSIRFLSFARVSCVVCCFADRWAADWRLPLVCGFFLLASLWQPRQIPSQVSPQNYSVQFDDLQFCTFAEQRFICKRLVRFFRFDNCIFRLL